MLDVDTELDCVECALLTEWSSQLIQFGRVNKIKFRQIAALIDLLERQRN
jgi:hypothetical protein